MQTNTKIAITKEEIVPVAKEKRAAGVMLIMIHAWLDDDGTPVVSYEYSNGPEVLSYEVRGERSLPSIESVYDLAAQWPEREISELMDITFEGLDTSKRLFMPDNLLSGEGQILVTPLSELRKENVEQRADGKQ
ncbi:MAG: NADH-quinone oxidoreductase subunit C [Eubacteriales bacterium]|nr:NADH-quinone oxidoreductase subunit C [Eubacteriales bacterium]